MIKNTLIIVRKFSVYSNFHRVWHGHIIKCGPGKHHKISYLESRKKHTGEYSKKKRLSDGTACMSGADCKFKNDESTTNNDGLSSNDNANPNKINKLDKSTNTESQTIENPVSEKQNVTYINSADNVETNKKIEDSKILAKQKKAECTKTNHSINLDTPRIAVFKFISMIKDLFFPSGSDKTETKNPAKVTLNTQIAIEGLNSKNVSRKNQKLQYVERLQAEMKAMKPMKPVKPKSDENQKETGSDNLGGQNKVMNEAVLRSANHELRPLNYNTLQSSSKEHIKSFMRNSPCSAATNLEVKENNMKSKIKHSEPSRNFGVFSRLGSHNNTFTKVKEDDFNNNQMHKETSINSVSGTENILNTKKTHFSDKEILIQKNCLNSASTTPELKLGLNGRETLGRDTLNPPSLNNPTLTMNTDQISPKPLSVCDKCVIQPEKTKPSLQADISPKLDTILKTETTLSVESEKVESPKQDIRETVDEATMQCSIKHQRPLSNLNNANKRDIPLEDSAHNLSNLATSSSKQNKTLSINAKPIAPQQSCLHNTEEASTETKQADVCATVHMNPNAINNPSISVPTLKAEFQKDGSEKGVFRETVNNKSTMHLRPKRHRRSFWRHSLYNANKKLILQDSLQSPSTANIYRNNKTNFAESSKNMTRNSFTTTEPNVKEISLYKGQPHEHNKITHAKMAPQQKSIYGTVAAQLVKNKLSLHADVKISLDPNKNTIEEVLITAPETETQKNQAYEQEVVKSNDVLSPHTSPNEQMNLFLKKSLCNVATILNIKVDLRKSDFPSKETLTKVPPVDVASIQPTIAPKEVISDPILRPLSPHEGAMSPKIKSNAVTENLQNKIESDTIDTSQTINITNASQNMIPRDSAEQETLQKPLISPAYGNIPNKSKYLLQNLIPQDSTTQHSTQKIQPTPIDNLNISSQTIQYMAPLPNSHPSEVMESQFVTQDNAKVAQLIKNNPNETETIQNVVSQDAMQYSTKPLHYSNQQATYIYPCTTPEAMEKQYSFLQHRAKLAYNTAPHAATINPYYSNQWSYYYQYRPAFVPSSKVQDVDPMQTSIYQKSGKDSVEQQQDFRITELPCEDNAFPPYTLKTKNTDQSSLAGSLPIYEKHYLPSSMEHKLLRLKKRLEHTRKFITVYRPLTIRRKNQIHKSSSLNVKDTAFKGPKYTRKGSSDYEKRRSPETDPTASGLSNETNDPYCKCIDDINHSASNCIIMDEHVLEECLHNFKTPFVACVDGKLLQDFLWTGGRNFKPWTPIPSWPVPRKHPKPPVQCPKHGCPIPLPPKDGSFCQPREKPCTGFPKRDF